MPNRVVPANAGGISRFNRSAIMKAAHRYAQAYKGRDWSYAYLLKHGLRIAWADAKSGITAEQRRTDAIRAEIDALKYTPVHMNFERRQKALQQQLSALAA